MMIKTRNKRTAAVFILFAAALSAVIFFGKESASGALKGINLCLNVLVPSIFPFTALSVFAAESGLSQALGKVTEKACRAVFNVSGNLSAVLIMSMIGGYPVGARGIAALRKRGAITESDAEKAAYIAVGAGPGFLINFVGAGLLGCQAVGVCMLLAQIIAVIILGLLNRIIFKGDSNNNSVAELKSKPVPFSTALTESVISSTYAMLEMCGMVIIFSAGLGITERFLGGFNIFVSVLAEVTSACNYPANENNIALIAFSAGFGGLCVHFQVFAALRDLRFNKGLFFLYRIIQGIITAVITSLLIKAFNISLPVFSSVGYTPELSLSASAIGSAMLILCGLGFLLYLGGHYVRNSGND